MSATPRSDTHRCQECGGFGQVQSVETTTSDPGSAGTRDGPVKNSEDWGRVRSREMKCRDCGHRWRNTR